jgi:hypothetical protein
VVAGARPDTLGVPYTRWSLSKLSRYLRTQGIEVSPAQLGRILARNGISLQRTRSWKQSPDLDYEAKAARILALYREQPENGVVISFDEKGPDSLCPRRDSDHQANDHPLRTGVILIACFHALEIRRPREGDALAVFALSSASASATAGLSPRLRIRALSSGAVVCDKANGRERMTSPNPFELPRWRPLAAVPRSHRRAEPAERFQPADCRCERRSR